VYLTNPAVQPKENVHEEDMRETIWNVCEGSKAKHTKGTIPVRITCLLRLESTITERSHLMKYRRPMVDGYRMIPHQPPRSAEQNKEALRKKVPVRRSGVRQNTQNLFLVYYLFITLFFVFTLFLRLEST
jgi:hypothetical protein